MRVEPYAYQYCKTVGCNCICCHFTFVCCPRCLACLCKDEVIYGENNHIYRKVNAPQSETMTREEPKV